MRGIDDSKVTVTERASERDHKDVDSERMLAGQAWRPKQTLSAGDQRKQVTGIRLEHRQGE